MEKNKEWKTIGNLTAEATKLVQVKDTPHKKSNGHQSDSKTTGLVKANLKPKQAGTEVSITGYDLQSHAKQFSKNVNPLAVTMAAEDLVRLHTTLSLKWSDGAHEPIGYEVGELTDELKDFVAKQCLPLTAKEMSHELTTLAALTKRRDNGEIDTKTFVQAYVTKLADYPADVVKYVLANAARDSKFFPAWAELYDELEYWGRSRLRLKDAIDAV